MVDLIRGKYRIVREIARSNDVVYEAYDTALGRRIAIKELNIAPALTGHPRRERIERFNREARAAGRLSHPNIVSVFEFGEENGRHFIAMEYLEGQNLRDLLQLKQALPLTEAIGIACQVLDALSYAHTHGVIHRDIKPDNIHLLPTGQVKITDFGIARLTEEPALTSNGQVFGTPSYMSPEQIEGRNVDFRTDIYSLGVVLYEILAGRKPFVGDSVVSITYSVMNSEPPPVPGIPTGVEQVIRRALVKQPAGRQASANQMKIDLRAAEQTPPMFLPLPPQYTGYGMASYSGTLPPAAPPAQPQLAGQQAGLPWQWNGMAGQAAPPPLTGIPQPAPTGSQLLPPNAMASPPFPVRPREPLFVLSPGGRTLLISLVVAALLGGGLAVGVMGFFHAYEQSEANGKAQRSLQAIDQGVKAYNARDFAAAAARFEQAKTGEVSAEELSIIDHNLAATYIQLARIAAVNGKLGDARDDYQKAIAAEPDSTTAHAELADVLARLGATEQASQEKEEAGISAPAGQAQNAGQSDDAPATLNAPPPTTPDLGPHGVPSDQFMAQQEQKASQFIAQGDALWRQGQTDQARDKWMQAIETAPGTPERDAAQQRIDGQVPASGGQ